MQVCEEAPGLSGIGVTPSLMIGQWAPLVQGQASNVLWNCLSAIVDAGLAAIESLGGVDAIASSHPNSYGVLVDWARAQNAPISLPAADRPWGRRLEPAIRSLEGSALALGEGLTLVHYAGGAADWRPHRYGDGSALVNFMYSFPILISLRTRPHGIGGHLMGWRSRAIVRSATRGGRLRSEVASGATSLGRSLALHFRHTPVIR